MRTSLILKITPYLILLNCLWMFVHSLFKFTKIPQFYGYSVSLTIAFCCLNYYFKKRHIIAQKNRFLCVFYNILIFYTVIGFILAYFFPSSIYPFIRMNVYCSFLSFGLIFIFKNEYVWIRLFKLWWKYVPITFVLLWWKLEPSMYAFVLSFCLFFILFVDEMKITKKIIVYVFLIIIGIWGMQQRITYITLILPIVLLIFDKTGLAKNKKLCNIILHSAMWLPIILFILGITGKFNILAMDSYVKEGYVSNSAGKMTEDTRTFLYEEALSSAVNNQYLIWGRTPAYGMDSPFVQSFDDAGYVGMALTIKGKMPQRICEAFIPNIITWCGILGFLIFFLLFYKFSYRIINKSNNIKLRILGLYMTFFWICSFITYPSTSISSDWIIVYLTIAISSSPQIMKLNDKEFALLIRKATT